ncbi:hypothetical protein CW109_05655 [Salmonella enterica subsp. enterica serovar Brandenburg]|nr:hypothetical protein [Salmonella enterica subsp. enterica serovar Brandenburg]EFB1638188.1 hypothetical protein [Escherichia coli]EDI2759138.1 hypothetical protein [Salmonella enterica subsp. enterica serovar Brandenburg]EDL4642381.1 hypothetical protein [Salmonella enterica subsp. enterica serovar Brandenburg]EDL7056143.1 hypothetical protein [Salmonella enterica subsp. enterica serovar Brandenburg]
MVSLPLFTSSRLISIAVRSPRINPQLHLLDPHLTPKSLAYAPVRERFFSHISNFNSEEVEVSDQHCHVTPDNYKNTFFLRKRTARAVLTGRCYSVGSVMRQGSSSLTRLTGQSAMTSSTWRR